MSRAFNLFGSLFQSFEVAECLHDRSPYVVVLTLVCCSMSCPLRLSLNLRLISRNMVEIESLFYWDLKGSFNQSFLLVNFAHVFM